MTDPSQPIAARRDFSLAYVSRPVRATRATRRSIFFRLTCTFWQTRCLVAGLQWVPPKNRCKALAYACGCAGLCLLPPSRVAGASGHVENRCPRLSPAAYEELDARVLLLLNSEGGGAPLPAVVCSEGGSWVEWR